MRRRRFWKGVSLRQVIVCSATLLNKRKCRRVLRCIFELQTEACVQINLRHGLTSCSTASLTKRQSRITERFPIFLSRSIDETRTRLQAQGIGVERCGLVGSSGAARLRAEGLEPNSSFHADYPWEHWYLAEQSDVRSSFRCEVFATEFEIQGLELDWIGLCWGGDFIWDQ